MARKNWIAKELGEILTFNYGWSLPEKKRVAGDVPVYGSNGIVGFHNQALVNTAGLIIGRKGSAGNAHYSCRPFCPIDTTFYISQSDTIVDLQFLYFLLLHIDLKRILGDVGVPGLNRETAYKETAFFPEDKFEQKKIAAILGTIQKAIEEQERLIALTAELKKNLMHQLFTQGLRGESQKETEIGPVPESWEVATIGSLGKIVTGSTPKTKIAEYYSPAEIDFITPADLGEAKTICDSAKKISRKGLLSIRSLPSKTVMCVCIGSSIGKVGQTSKTESATNQQINSIICHQRHDGDFVFYLLSYLRDYWKGFGTFGPVPILSKGAFAVIKVSLPKTKEEETEIAKSLNALDAKLEIHRRKHTILTALFRTLLKQLMTADIQVDSVTWEGL